MESISLLPFPGRVKAGGVGIGKWRYRWEWGMKFETRRDVVPRREEREALEA
jgi:hypothetical protein